MRDSSALRASAEPWPGLPRVSTAEAAWALGKAGYEARLAGPDHFAILRDGFEVGHLPVHETLHPGTLSAFLRTIGVSVADFVSFLQEPPR